jgi:hypothetical protein
MESKSSGETKNMSSRIIIVKGRNSNRNLLLGGSFFVLSLICPVFIPVVRMLGLPENVKNIASGALVIGIPQVFTFLAVIVLGKKGFNLIKEKLFGYIKTLGPPKTVSKTRYRIGLVMFVSPLIFALLAPYAPEFIPYYEANRITINITGEIILLCSLVVLGGDFWDKLRALFIYEHKEH